MTTFRKGDRVRLIGDATKHGTVISEPLTGHAPGIGAKVLWDGYKTGYYVVRAALELADPVVAELLVGIVPNEPAAERDPSPKRQRVMSVPATPIVDYSDGLSLDWDGREKLFTLHWIDTSGNLGAIQVTPMAAGFIAALVRQWAGAVPAAEPPSPAAGPTDSRGDEPAAGKAGG